MSKISQYLNEHLIGDAISAKGIRERYATDASLLQITPELVVFPRVTNDIRKVARFSWQLAEKGHVLSMTARGSGSDATGGAIGSGIVIDTTHHLSRILYIALKDKQKIVHVQPGVSLAALNSTLQWHGLTIAGAAGDKHATVGGAIAKASRGTLSGKYGTVADLVERLEVVLANGDLLETGRISKRDVGKKKGLQTLEGEIYRQVDGILDDYQELISTLSSERDALGYQIDKVRDKDGSIDLTPLFVGSQGTLGIISEAVLRTNFYSQDQCILVTTIETAEEGRDAVDQLRELEPSVLELIDGEYYRLAQATGKKYVLGSTGDVPMFQSLVYVAFDDFSDRARDKKIAKAQKILAKRGLTAITSTENKQDDLLAIRDVAWGLSMPVRSDESFPPLCNGAYIPRERQEEFVAAVAALAAKHHSTLPISINALDDTVSVRPTLRLQRVGDKQKVFKMLSEYAALVYSFGGTVSGTFAEGRTNAFAAYPHIGEDVVALYAAIRQVFDPFGTLNPGVKQATDIRVIAKQLRTEYDIANQL